MKWFCLKFHTLMFQSLYKDPPVYGSPQPHRFLFLCVGVTKKNLTFPHLQNNTRHANYTGKRMPWKLYTTTVERALCLDALSL